MATPLPSASPPREGFALSGRSVMLDARSHAVRPDLADIRLAEYVFAPHYAAAVACSLAATATLRASRDPESEILATVHPGDVFEVLEFAGTHAWGIAPGLKLVGYVPAAALGHPA